jgi:hypothetical protein
MKQVLRLVVLVMLAVNLLGGEAAVAAFSTKGMNLDTLPEWQMKTTSKGGKLLLSDSPEMVLQDGILYQDKVEGKVRLFFYHVNASADVKKMAVILENRGRKPAQVNVSQAILSGPDYSWIAVGKGAQNLYFSTKKNTYTLTLPPGAIMPLSADIEEKMMPNMLINGIYDFTVDNPITVKVMMLPVTEDSVKFSKNLKVLPADQCHMRGTFNGADREISPVDVYDPVQDGTIGITLADNHIDTYLDGIDATDGSKVVNYGNYGVVYQVLLPSKKGGRITYYLTPLGGDYAGFIKINHPEVYWSPLAIPRDKLYFGNNKQNDFAFIGTFESGDPLSVTFSPPGASNLPVKLIAVPQ